MAIRTIEWKNNGIKLIDQRKLPGKLEYIYIKNLKDLWQAIRKMKIRGAPALGAAAALGLYLGIRNLRTKSFRDFYRELNKIAEYISTSRPTARNLFWAIERLQKTALSYKHKPIAVLKKLLFEEAKNIIEEDRKSCRKMAKYGAKLIDRSDSILTICNAGILATIDYGTALGIIYRAKELGKKIKVYALETRPMLQGARLTTWELKKKGIDVTLICDNMAAVLLEKGEINKIITGADRIALNGDSANKIGTYNLAVLAKYHKIPFYIAAPASTFDININTGKDIIIEERDSREITSLFFKEPIAAKGIKVFNPAFDVTPNKLISAIVTEKGIIKPPYRNNIKSLMSNDNKYAHK